MCVPVVCVLFVAGMPRRRPLRQSSGRANACERRNATTTSDARARGAYAVPFAMTFIAPRTLVDSVSYRLVAGWCVSRSVVVVLVSLARAWRGVVVVHVAGSVVSAVWAVQRHSLGDTFHSCCRRRRRQRPIETNAH